MAKKKGDYEVGFGKPPRHSRFSPGVSGNPGGKKKGTSNTATLVRRELEEKITARDENGREFKLTKHEAMIKMQVNKAVKGDPKAWQLINDALREGEARDASEPESIELSPDVIASYLRRCGGQLDE